MTVDGSSAPRLVEVRLRPRRDGSAQVSYAVRLRDACGRRRSRDHATLSAALHTLTRWSIPGSRATPGRCPRCAAPVLRVKASPHTSGRPRILDLPELLTPMTCPICRTWRDVHGRKRQADIVCWRCQDTRVIGAPLPGHDVYAVDEDGQVRAYAPGAVRRRGEALHRKHRCGRPVPGALPARDLDQIRAGEDRTAGLVARHERRRPA